MVRFIRLTLLVSQLLPFLTYGQPGTITSFMGTIPEQGNAADVALTNPGYLAIDKDGTLYVAESHSVKTISPSGQARPLIRTTGFYCNSEGIDPKAPSALANWSTGLVTDGQGTVFMLDSCLFRILRVTNDGRAVPHASMIGPAMVGLARDPEGNLYAAPTTTHQIMKVTPSGQVERFAGQPRQGYGGDGGPAFDALFNNISGLASDAEGNIYIADSGNLRIRRINRDGRIETIAGTGEPGFSGDGGPATEARIGFVQQIALDREGSLLLVDRWNRRIRKVGLDGIITSIAGDGRSVSAGDGGPALEASLGNPTGVAAGPDGSIFVSDSTDMVVRRVSPDGTIHHYAGVARFKGENGPAALARVVAPLRSQFTPDGAAYVLERGGRGAVRRVEPDGRVSTLAFPDWVSIWPDCLAVSDDNHIYFCLNNEIWRRTPDGAVERFAGRRNEFGYAGDGGPAIDALLAGPIGLRFDGRGNLYFVDAGNHAVRRIRTDGTIEAVAGNGNRGRAGDGGPAVNATLQDPGGIALDKDGNLFIADKGNNRVRKVDKEGTITTIFGSDRPGELTDGVLATTTSPMYWPQDVAVDRKGNVYTTSSAEIWKITTSGRVYRVAGGIWGMTAGDGGPARNASLQIHSLSVDPNDNLYAVDRANNRIRRIEGFSPFTASPRALVFSAVPGSGRLTQDFVVASADNEPHEFQIQVSAPWLSLTPFRGKVDDRTRVTVRVTVTPPTRPGYYSTRIRLLEVGAEDYVDVPVSLLVSNTPQQMRLGQTGLRFVAVENGPAPLSQTLPVLNVGLGSMSWNAAVSTLSGGNWLQLSPPQGLSEAGRPAPELTLSVRTTGLAAGVYYGLVTVRSPQADNAPQSAVVVLTVVRPGDQSGGFIDPQGLLFTGGAAVIPPQSVRILNPFDRNLSYTAQAEFPDRTTWFQVGLAGAPANPNGASGLIPPGRSVELTVRPVGRLEPGVYTGTVTIRFQPEQVTQTVSVTMVVPPTPAGAAASKEGSRLADGCTPTRLVPVFRAPGANFSATAGWPTSIDVLAVDNCGNPMNTGRAAVTFSTGGVPVLLAAAGNGRWTGTWAAGGARPGRVTLQLRMESESPRLEGQAQLVGAVTEGGDRPQIQPGGVLNLANPDPDGLVSVAGLTAVVGQRLAAGTQTSGTAAWPLELGETRVFVAGQPAALRQVAEGRIEAVLPMAIPGNTRHQLVVQRGRSYSPPEDLLVTSLSPAVFSADGTGRGQGLIFVVGEEGEATLADAGRPVLPGDLLHIRLAGLGVTTPPVPTGQPAPADPLAKVQLPVRVTIDEQRAEVVSAELEPGQVGVYRIVVRAPEGIRPSASAPVAVTVGEVDCPPIAVVAGAPPESQ